MYQRILKLKYRLARIWQAGIFGCAVMVLLHRVFTVLSRFFALCFFLYCHSPFILCFLFYFYDRFCTFFSCFYGNDCFSFLRALTFTEIFLAAFVVFLMVTIFFFEEVTVTLSVVFFEVTVFVTGKVSAFELPFLIVTFFFVDLIFLQGFFTAFADGVVVGFADTAGVSADVVGFADTAGISADGVVDGAGVSITGAFSTFLQWIT